MKALRIFLASALVAASAAVTGCSTGAFCYRDCDGDSDGGAGGDTGASDANGEPLPFDSGPCFLCDANDDGATGDACTPTNGGVEVCDGVDNDCNGVIDDADVSSPDHCGTCTNNCVNQVLNATAATCNFIAKGVPGTCGYVSCASGYYDLDKNAANGCEYYCVPATINGAPVTSETDPSLRCNHRDDDCDGQIDEDVDLCSDGLNCGTCGRSCTVLHGSGTCAHTGTGTCDPSNTGCAIAACDPGWQDVDGNYATGCEYQCTPTQGGVEICDGLDNDCNGFIDGADKNFADPRVGAGCTGGSTGVCNDPAHAGTYACKAGTIVCVASTDGGTVVVPGQNAEVCNGLDDDCNGLVDDNVQGYGAACGSSVGACQAGVQVCTGGVMSCQGAIGPQPETCNGQDDDCDGVIDDNPALAGTSCGLAAGACKAGTYQCQSGSLVCVGATTPSTELCNGIDDDCNGKVDDNVPGTGVLCGSSVGACKQGTIQCQSAQLICVGAVTATAETCNGADDDCDGTVDDNLTDVGGSCGSAAGICTLGTSTCVSGKVVCSGATSGTTETCNALDDDCDGVTDGTALKPYVACTTDADCASQATAKWCATVYGQAGKVCATPSSDVGYKVACSVPPAAPAGGTEPCKAGVYLCQAGVKTCSGATTATASLDACGVDSNCDGQLTNQPDLSTDVHNCGSCGNDCTAGAVHANWTCSAGSCVFSSCQTGYWDNGGPGDAVAGDHKCGYACTFVSSAEACNGQDDNCNGQIDEGVVAPSTAQVCGAGFGATDPGCTTGVSVTCTSGSWRCVFPTGYCGGNGSKVASANDCASATDTCDGKDNNCNGVADEPFRRPARQSAVLTDPCNNGGTGACNLSGTYVCNAGGTDTTCSVQPISCSALSGGCTELCDGIDNDCDGSVDEPFSAKGSNSTYFVKPAVTKVQTAAASFVWMYSYEASRPSATTTTGGTGDGWSCATGPCSGSTPVGTVPVAPAGVTLDSTPACSVASKVPWFNVGAGEAEQACVARGGRICSTAEWQAAVSTSLASSTTCTYGYAPLGSACTSAYTASKYCNLGVSYDFDPTTAGQQSGLLPTGSALLKNCYADWTTLLTNTAATGKMYDMTGNLREITKTTSTSYTLMGGAFSTQSEAGAAQTFTFYAVDSTFQLYDTGFRCCFSADPTL